MKRINLAAFCIIGLVVASKSYANEEWKSSTLLAETIEIANKATQNYHACLKKEINAFNDFKQDLRDTSGIILKQCETKLSPIREAFLKEKVPSNIADRYLLRKRHQAARKVLQFMMYAKSQSNSAQTTK